MSKSDRFMLKRKKVIVLSFEGKNNMTENLYFSHFKACDNSYIIKAFSSGATDIVNMIKSTKNKRKKYDYNPKEDLTFIFVDGDDNSSKVELIKTQIKKQPKDICIILSNPCFELWFLNHFVYTTKHMNTKSLFIELNKYIIDYQKNKDVYPLICDKIDAAINNSENQSNNSNDNPKTNVQMLFLDKIMCKK